MILEHIHRLEHHQPLCLGMTFVVALTMLHFASHRIIAGFGNLDYVGLILGSLVVLHAESAPTVVNPKTGEVG